MKGVPFSVGNRVRVGAGYDMEPKWLGSSSYFEGELIKFIPGQNSEPAVVVKLDEAIGFENVTGAFLVLELRYGNAVWTSGEIVHVELLSECPPDKRWQDRTKGKWVESHARIALPDHWQIH